MNALIKFVLIMVGFYYLFRIIMRLLAPILVRKVAQKMQDNFKKNYQQQYNSTTDNQYNSNQNDVGKNPRSTKKVGEYIDYEEVE